MYAVLGVLSLPMTAQNEVEALRYSMSDVPVTGRSLGMGGSFGAVGADLSSFFTNPAGLGAYRRKNFEVSFGLNDAVAKSTYMGTPDDNGRTRFNLNNIGIVGNQQIENSDWKSVSWGIAHAKTNNFYQNINISGISNGTTMLDHFAGQAWGIRPEELANSRPFTSSLAYDTYGIDPANDDSTQYVASSYTGDIHQSKNIRRTGMQSETSMAIGGNFRDFLMVGMSINFLSVRFSEISGFTERFENDPSNYLSTYTFSENLNSSGTGVGVKLGAIVLPTPWLRVGAAYHSPTRISFTENYYTAMTSSIRGTSETPNYSSPRLDTEYTIRTPARLMASAAFVMGKMGIFSVDYEFASYDKIRMNGIRTNSYNYSYENGVIADIYQNAHRVRAGVEFRLLESTYLRGGAIYQQSPFTNGVGAVTTPRMTYTGGVGFRSDNFFIDLAAAYATSKENYYLYDPSLVDAAN